jgi:hypothetical protein
MPETWKEKKEKSSSMTRQKVWMHRRRATVPLGPDRGRSEADLQRAPEFPTSPRKAGDTGAYTALFLGTDTKKVYRYEWADSMKSSSDILPHIVCLRSTR